MTTEDKTQEERQKLINDLVLLIIKMESSGKDGVEGLIEYILADRKAQATRLLDAIEERGPDDKDTKSGGTMHVHAFRTGFNESSQMWRSILKELREKL